MRLFVAIDLTDEARFAIAELQKRVGARLTRGRPRFVRPEQLHLTLVFIGEVTDETGAAIVNCMRAEFNQRPFELVFAGLGVFPPHGAPRILWLGVSEGAGEAITLQRDVAGRLAAIGIRPEERPFSPHLTLARWREGRPSDRRQIDAERVGTVASIPVGAVTLYRSQLSSGGSTYSVLCRTPLIPATG